MISRLPFSTFSTVYTKSKQSEKSSRIKALLTPKDNGEVPSTKPQLSRSALASVFE